MFEVKDVKVSFKDKKVLKDVSFTVKKGKVYGVLGKNGAGKTTLFNTISNFLKYEGIIYLNNKKIKPNNISYLKTEAYFYPYMKAYEYFTFFDSLDKTSINLANIFDIPLDEYIHNFSTGMKKKTAIIANAILKKPVLIMDEPFNGLDIESVEKLYLLIEKLKSQGTIILLSSHILETLQKCCDKIGYLDNGRIIKEYVKKEFNILEKDLRESIKEDWNALINNA